MSWATRNWHHFPQNLTTARNCIVSILFECLQVSSGGSVEVCKTREKWRALFLTCSCHSSPLIRIGQVQGRERASAFTAPLDWSMTIGSGIPALPCAPPFCLAILKSRKWFDSEGKASKVRNIRWYTFSFNPASLTLGLYLTATTAFGYTSFLTHHQREHHRECEAFAWTGQGLRRIPDWS